MNQKKHFVVGRSMEFGIDLKSEILIVPSDNQTKVSQIQKKQGLQWIQKYAFIGLNALGIDRLIVDGINEEGLSFGALWLPGTKYQPLNENNLDNTIALQDVGSWLLGSFETVDQVKQALKQVNVFGSIIPALKEIPPLHFSIHDKSGNSLVVEFIGGKMQVSENPIGVLTNAPQFNWHITNLRNYINLTSLSASPIRFEGTVLDPTGQGSGMLGLPGDWTPPSRFIRVALFKEFVKKTKTDLSSVNLAFHLLNTVDIPYGAVQEANKKEFDYTQWAIVKDLSNATLYYRSYQNLNIYSISLKNALKNKIFKLKLD